MGIQSPKIPLKLSFNTLILWSSYLVSRLTLKYRPFHFKCNFSIQSYSLTHFYFSIKWADWAGGQELQQVKLGRLEWTSNIQFGLCC